MVEQATDGIRRAIVSGYYQPGDILPPVRMLAAMLGVSRIVTNEVVARLAAEGLVDPRPRLGSMVLAPDVRVWRGCVQFVYRNNPGSFYPTVADESYNKDYYNVKSYVVTNHNKVHRRMTYSASTYVDCNVGDTVYVCDTHHTTDAALAKKENALMPSNLGNYFMHPITMKDAINRIASDYNYRNVKRIVLVGDVALKESLNWCCDHPLEVVRDRKVKRLTINAKQNISCDVTFKKLNITLNSALCQTQRKECVNLSFEEDTITGNGFIVENTAQQESPSAVVYLSFDKQSTFASRKYFSDNSSQKPAAAYHVMVAGKQVSSISGATAARPADALYTGYCYFDTMLNKPIWWNGRNWVDSLGNSVDSSRYK